MTRAPLSLVVATLVVGLVALASVGWWWNRSLTSVQTSQVRTTSPPDSASVTDCPHVVECVTVTARPAVIAAVRAAFPSAKMIDSWRVEGFTGIGYSENVRVSLPRELVISVNARCVPGGARVVDRVIGGPPTTAPAPAPRGPLIASIVVGSERPGCSVAVSLVEPEDGAVPWAAAIALAQLPVLQIPT